MPKFEDISVGQWVETSTPITRQLILEFSRVIGDDNPVHFDERFARDQTFFRRCVAHGMISASLITASLGSQLPGHGTILLSQDLKFLSPVYPDDTVTVRLEVLEKEEVTQKIKLKTTVVNQKGTLVIDGHVWVMQRLPKIHAYQKP
ncbi:MAG: MaoC family dehydratase [Deltaproteobacteria bacterium]|jgi:3-hydroxybutyryl-CoA dehydratase|nr:MaoC family dehydratase [Deltaproteobacteria bacterium]